MDWPGNSPDLNPIKNCWSFIKAKLKEDYDHLAFLADLGNQDDVGEGAAPGLLLEAGEVNAQVHQGTHGRQRSNDKVLMCVKMLCKEIFFYLIDCDDFFMFDLKKNLS